VRAVLDLISPSLCLGCGSSCRDDLCLDCAEEVSVLVPPLCRRCGGPLPPRHRCQCRDLEGFDRAVSLVAYEGPARRLVLDLKRRGRRGLASVMGTLLAELVSFWGLYTGTERITFVPGAGRAKGYDHAEMLAGAMSRRLGTRPSRLLLREAKGPRQADVAFSERRHNVAGRFGATPCAGPVLVVDDVFTTGSTAEVCAQVLRSAGATSVTVVTWARTVRSRA
jgi:predicted amidophosphoribosyltransferase